ncbi:MAG: hypothetical protein PUG67_07250 [Peptoniphilaceae bacterium]|nr:hypothetical protein [Peptoniphilaceae bacterium]MDY6019567.1 hypothetical protein [Anaerococcus sp.]
MTSSARENLPILKKLEYNYLVNDDISSLNTLISLFDDKHFKVDPYKKVYVRPYILKNLRKFFWNLSNIDQIIECIDKTIGNELDRFEYLAIIKAQYMAFNDKKLIDELECKAIEYYGASFLFEHNKIFYENTADSIYIKNYYQEQILNDKNIIGKINKECKKYSDKYLKNKILNLDVNTNKQLAFNIDYIYTDDITLEQSNKINNKIINYLSKSVLEVFAENFWVGLVNEVIKRYH